MSVFQNSFLAGRTGFGSVGGYRRSRLAGGVVGRDQYGDAVRQAIQPPMNAMAMSRNQQSVARGAQPVARGQQSSGQDYSAYAQQMAPSRPDAPAAMPQSAQPAPQVARTQSAPGVVGSQSKGDGRTMSNAEYSAKLASFGSPNGGPLTSQQIWDRAQWAQKNARAMI